MGIIHILKGGKKMNLLKRLFVEEEGQGLVEYALIIGLIAIAAITILGILSGGITNIFTEISNKLSGIKGPTT